jgi:hypothetical protein
MTAKFFLYEFRHCGKEWRSKFERSRCRGCRKMVEAWSKELMNGPESIESFRAKFAGVLK